MKLRSAVAAAAFTLALVGAPVAAGAQAYPGGTTEVRDANESSVLGNAVDSADSPAVANTSTSSAPTNALPVTGGDVIGLALIGGGLVAGGTVLVRRARRSAQPA